MMNYIPSTYRPRGYPTESFRAEMILSSTFPLLKLSVMPPVIEAGPPRSGPVHTSSPAVSSPAPASSVSYSPHAAPRLSAL